MLNRIIHFSLYNRLTVVILSAVILIAGTLAMLRTDVDIFPDLNAPTVVVMTEARGLTPEEVEKVVSYRHSPRALTVEFGLLNRMGRIRLGH